MKSVCSIYMAIINFPEFIEISEGFGSSDSSYSIYNSMLNTDLYALYRIIAINNKIVNKEKNPPMHVL